MAIRCPGCARRIRSRDVDVAADRISCRACGKATALSAVMGADQIEAIKRIADESSVSSLFD